MNVLSCDAVNPDYTTHTEKKKKQVIHTVIKKIYIWMRKWISKWKRRTQKIHTMKNKKHHKKHPKNNLMYNIKR